MPDLEPITREEILLDGGDLTPITRKEMFIKRIYDKTQSVPEPITREEYFLKKAGEGSGDVTIEQLNVTENGTYSESGKAYSPVVVNVPTPPIPENAYLLNNLSGLPADIASFNDGTDLPMASLKVAVTPYQDLSHGDPSPDNICPIIGWDEANVTVADDVETPTVENVYTIDLNGTRYGGVVDAVSGVMEITHEYVEYDGSRDEYWQKHPTLESWFCIDQSIPNAYLNNSKADYAISNMYKQKEYLSVADLVNGEFALGEIRNRLVFKNTNYADLVSFKNGLVSNPIQLCYKLATPITVQLAKTPVKSLVGTNNIFANCGQITEVKYFKKA